MKSVLFYNLFPKNSWKEITASILSNVPHDEIIVHVSMPLSAWMNIISIRNELSKYHKVIKVFFSQNSKSRGETVGFDKVRRKFDFSQYDIFTYAHSKGSSRKRKNTPPIKDWAELMRYFVVEKLDLCSEAFNNGFWFYGINKSRNIYCKNDLEEKMYENVSFIYEGNFVSINLAAIRDRFLTEPCLPVYYGLERFWGKLGPTEKAFSAHQSTVDHYLQRYPSERYVKQNR